MLALSCAGETTRCANNGVTITVTGRSNVAPSSLATRMLKPLWGTLESAAITVHPNVTTLCAPTTLVLKVALALRFAARPLTVAVNPVSGMALRFCRLTMALALPPATGANARKAGLAVIPRMLNCACAGPLETPGATAVTV